MPTGPNDEHTVFPDAYDATTTFKQMPDSPKAIGMLREAITTGSTTLKVSNIANFDGGPSLVTIGGTEEIIAYEVAVADGDPEGNGQLQLCTRNWGHNLAAGPQHAHAGVVVAQLWTGEQLRLMSESIIAIQAKLGVNGARHWTNLTSEIDDGYGNLDTQVQYYTRARSLRQYLAARVGTIGFKSVGFDEDLSTRGLALARGSDTSYTEIQSDGATSGAVYTPNEVVVTGENGKFELTVEIAGGDPDDVRVFIGLFESDPVGSAEPNIVCAGFRYDSGDADGFWHFVWRNGAGETFYDIELPKAHYGHNIHILRFASLQQHLCVYGPDAELILADPNLNILKLLYRSDIHFTISTGLKFYATIERLNTADKTCGIKSVLMYA